MQIRFVTAPCVVCFWPVFPAHLVKTMGCKQACLAVVLLPRKVTKVPSLAVVAWKKKMEKELDPIQVLKWILQQKQNCWQIFLLPLGAFGLSSLVLLNLSGGNEAWGWWHCFISSRVSTRKKLVSQWRFLLLGSLGNITRLRDVPTRFLGNILLWIPPTVLSYLEFFHKEPNGSLWLISISCTGRIVSHSCPKMNSKRKQNNCISCGSVKWLATGSCHLSNEEVRRKWGDLLLRVPGSVSSANSITLASRLWKLSAGGLVICHHPYEMRLPSPLDQGLMLQQYDLV